ncbi:unnamed protein product [Fusarium venenatum]|uniref:ATP-dependent DNA helicase n=1 Tax=Fusarium venenatum TaxID=56646 RepID=A0A2L2TG80_9HYPO|nr:uncharacterized protein FVRRES_06462 [Fusarium venenatum]CEI62026.1 unnamed protein product [Fusarium venenatum]
MEQIAGQISLNDYFRPIPPPLPQRQAMQRSLPPPPPSPERQELAVSFISISSDEDEPDTRELTGPTLCREQQDLLNLIMSDENVFFTGSAGCGKSTVLKAAIAQLQAAGKKVAVTAPTGRAALNVDGITLYSYMGWNTNDVKLDLDKLKGKMYGQAKKNIRKSLKATYVLIIVEISMVENNFLSRMEAVLRDIRHIERPWGGLQLIVTGDFCQLPSVLPFQNCWEIHRQSDRPFIKTLQKCRLGIPCSEQEFDMLLNHESEVENATQLVCKRKEAKKVNAEKLDEITEHTPKDYKCEDGIWFPPSYDGRRDTFSDRTKERNLAYFDDRHRFNIKVELKKTQLVMLLGVIVDWEQIDMEKLPKFDGPDGDLKTTHVGLFTDEYMRNNPEPKNQVWPVVRFSNGYKKTIYPVCLVHSVNDHLGIKVFRTQIPLIPGWAITIHKSQGMTLERVIVNLKNTFEVGQAYVAHCQEQRA